MTPDPYHPTFTHLQDLFLQQDPNYEGRYTTPTLYDTTSQRIVSNESADIVRMMDTAFDCLLYEKESSNEFYPEDQRYDIDSANDWIYHGINNGVYRAGFAQYVPELLCCLQLSHTD